MDILNRRLTAMRALLHKEYLRRFVYSRYYRKFRGYTMLPRSVYVDNLLLTHEYCRQLQGDVIECGVWKGGMIAGIAQLLGNGREYYLFDSFEGLPPAQTIDGLAALSWQADIHGKQYYDNCTAEERFAHQAMTSTQVTYHISKGWFKDSLPLFSQKHSRPISLLRLDGDWYESTIIALEYLYPKVMKGGMVIIDDYHAWEGCSRAVHDYLSQNKSPSRISQSSKGVTYIIKQD